MVQHNESSAIELLPAARIEQVHVDNTFEFLTFFGDMVCLFVGGHTFLNFLRLFATCVLRCLSPPHRAPCSQIRGNAHDSDSHARRMPVWHSLARMQKHGRRSLQISRSNCHWP